MWQLYQIILYELTLTGWVSAIKHGKDRLGKVSEAVAWRAEGAKIAKVVIAVIIVNMINIQLYWVQGYKITPLTLIFQVFTIAFVVLARIIIWFNTLWLRVIPPLPAPFTARTVPWGAISPPTLTLTREFLALLTEWATIHVLAIYSVMGTFMHTI